MTDTYKVLGQTLTGELAIDNLTVKEIVAYEVPANTQASISAIEITNSDTVDQTYKLSFVPSSEVATSFNTVEVSTTVGEKVFVAVARNSSSGNPTTVAAYSTNGTSWTAISMPAYNWTSLSYGNGKFVAVTDNSNALAYSTNGIDWTIGSAPSIQWVAFKYLNDKFVAFQFFSNLGFYSIDGISWTQTTIPQMLRWTGLAYGDGKYVAVANYNTNYNSTNVFAYSTDGINWTQGTMPFNLSWNSVTYGDEKFVAVGGSSSTAAYSTDGINWTQSTLPSFNNWRLVTYANNKFVAITDNGQPAYSADGINWTASTTTLSNQCSSLTYGNNKFVVFSAYSSTAAYSTDGITWTQSTLPLSGLNWTAVEYADLTEIQINTQSIPQSLNKHYSIYNKTIAAGETHEIKGGVTLSAGDQIRIYSDSDEIITNVYGVEIA